MIDDMQVYIANLGKYNEGELVGDWFSFPLDEEVIAERIGLNAEYEEYAIHDTDNFPMEISEYISISELNRIYEQLEELPDYLLDDLDSFVLAPVSGDYVFSELVNPVFTEDGDNLKVSVSVKYLDNKSKMTQISQYELVLHKDDNWKIVE